jgi:hypothetical protein
MNQIEIAVTGSEQVEDLEALDRWLRDEPELRGLIERAPAIPGHNELGAFSDALVAAVGAGGALSVLASSLKVFFAQPRGERLHLTVTRADGSKAELDADRVRHKSVPQLVQLLLETDPADADADTDLDADPDA